VRAEVRHAASGEYEVRIFEQDCSDRAIVQRFTTIFEVVATIRAAAERLGWENLSVPILVELPIPREMRHALKNIASEREVRFRKAG
jgi:hypothetical protein